MEDTTTEAYVILQDELMADEELQIILDELSSSKSDEEDNQMPRTRNPNQARDFTGVYCRLVTKLLQLTWFCIRWQGLWATIQNDESTLQQNPWQADDLFAAWVAAFDAAMQSCYEHLLLKQDLVEHIKNLNKFICLHNSTYKGAYTLVPAEESPPVKSGISSSASVFSSMIWLIFSLYLWAATGSSFVRVL